MRMRLSVGQAQYLPLDLNAMRLDPRRMAQGVMDGLMGQLALEAI